MCNTIKKERSHFAAETNGIIYDFAVRLNGVKMYSFEIFADSSANIPQTLVKKHKINIISYRCTVNGSERDCYTADENFENTAKKFYAAMREGADVKTSLVGEDAIIQAVSPAMQSGKDVLLITISAGISGTYNQALNAKKVLEEKYSNAKLYVCDSANASLGQGMLVLKAAVLREMGESAKVCADWVNQNAYKLNSYFTVADLKYLRKGGRISAAVAIAGAILNIKPVLRANGETPARLAFFSKERGRKKAISALIEAFKNNAENVEGATVAIAHADCADEAAALAEEVKNLGAAEVITEYYDICTGAHAGPGTLALFFFGKDRRTPAHTPLSLAIGKKKAKQKIR